MVREYNTAAETGIFYVFNITTIFLVSLLQKIELGFCTCVNVLNDYDFDVHMVND